jgi:hypothetical protein
MADIAGLHDRLRRVPTDVVGAIFSASDYAPSATREVEANRTREMLLFSPEEVGLVLAERLNLHELIRMKRSHLRNQGTVWFYTQDFGAKRTAKLRDCHDLLKVNSARVDSITCNSHSSEILFARSLPDTGWAGLGGRSVVLSLRLMLRDYRDLESVLAKIDQIFGLSNQGSYSIQQTATSWFGFGAASFLRDVSAWQTRYARAMLRTTHHTEEIAYFDRFREGWVIVTARHHVRGRRDCCFLSAECTIQLSGVPVDMAPYARLCRETNNQDARFVPVVTPDFYSVRLVQEHRLTVVGEIVSRNREDEPMVTGLIVENPFFNASELPRELLDQDSGCPLRYINETAYLICDLLNWHDCGDVMDYYVLEVVDGRWAGGRIVLHPMCRWHKMLKRAVPEDQHRDRFKQLIERQIAECEDQ